VKKSAAEAMIRGSSYTSDYNSPRHSRRLVIENIGEDRQESTQAMSEILGCYRAIVKVIARIHEPNLNEAGMLGLTFANPSDYDLIQENDTSDILV